LLSRHSAKPATVPEPVSSMAIFPESTGNTSPTRGMTALYVTTSTSSTMDTSATCPAVGLSSALPTPSVVAQHGSAAMQTAPAQASSVTALKDGRQSMTS